MTPKTNRQAATPWILSCNSYRRLVFIMTGVFLIVGSGFSSTAKSQKTLALSNAGSAAMLESMPLWGGAASLNIASQATSFEEGINLHHFAQIACGNCHQTPVASGTVSLSEGQTDWKTGVQINQSCTSFGCHEYDQTMNHPVGGSVPTNRAGQMSLGQSSEITCLTCHEADRMADSSNFDIQPERFLTSPDQTICQSCHGQLSGSPKQRSHWKFSQKAHLVSLVSGSEIDGNSDDPMVPGIDSESQNCLSCHDEVSAVVPAMNGKGHRVSRGYNMSDHPIGMDYQSVLTANSMEFNPLSGDQNRMRMFDGKVGCGSCHSLYSQTPFHLAVKNESNALCRKCHNR